MRVRRVRVRNGSLNAPNAPEVIVFATLLAVLLLSTAPSDTAAAPASDTALVPALDRDLTTYLKTRSKAEHISALSLVISFPHDRRRIRLAEGTMQYGGGAPITTSTLFQIGSNTKAFTSVLLLRDVAAGKVSLDDPLGKWFPQYPAWRTVKIRQLLNMTSGIPTYDDTPRMEADYSKNPFINYSPEQLIAYVYPTLKTPGAAYLYSNTGYILAQMIVAKLSPSRSYEAELETLIADEQLPDPYYAAHHYPPGVAKRLVSGYEANTDDRGLAKLLYTDTSRYSLSWTQGAGGMISTPDALTTWIRKLFEGKVLPPAQMHQLTSVVSTKTAKPIAQTTAAEPKSFGLGVAEMYDPGLGRFWFYQGSTIGYRALYMYQIRTGLIISIFTNSQASAAQDKLHDLLIRVYGELQSAH